MSIICKLHEKMENDMKHIELLLNNFAVLQTSVKNQNII